MRKDTGTQYVHVYQRVLKRRAAESQTGFNIIPSSCSLWTPSPCAFSCVRDELSEALKEAGVSSGVAFPRTEGSAR